MMPQIKRPFYVMKLQLYQFMFVFTGDLIR
jgi:hypothetical protein